MEDARRALQFARQLQGKIEIVKVGSRLFTAEGPQFIRKLTQHFPGVFLDLKFHDIPNTVAGAVRVAAGIPGVRMMTLHASGGTAMMRAAREALAGARRKPMLLAVTVLTSMDKKELAGVGISRSPEEQALRLARLAKAAGMDGVVASPLEVAKIRKACGPSMTIVVPGIRLEEGRASRGTKAPDDQRRIATPAVALAAGADYLVIGRPILDAADPAAATEAILREMSGNSVRAPRKK